MRSEGVRVRLVLVLVFLSFTFVILAGTQVGAHGNPLYEEYSPTEISASGEWWSVWQPLWSLGPGTRVQLFFPDPAELPVFYHQISLLVSSAIVTREGKERFTQLRAQILATIEVEPGIHLRGLQQQVGCAMGTLQYHIYALTTAGLVLSFKHGRCRHFFSQAFHGKPLHQHLIVLLRNPLTRAIIKACMHGPTLCQNELATSLGLDKRLMSYYMRRLLREGIVELSNNFSRHRHYILRSYIQQGLHQLRDIGISLF